MLKGRLNDDVCREIYSLCRTGTKDRSGQAETLSIQDGTTGAILDTRNVSAFQNGTYVVWNVSGHVVLNVTDTGGDNAVISGLFFDVPSVATSTFSPSGGTYAAAQTVTITTATPGASIRYTTDGTAPSATVGIPYSGPVTVGSTSTLKAIAYASGFANSAVASANYTIAAPASNTAIYVSTDTTTQGNWTGTYGANGYNVIGSTAGYPSYVAATPSGQTSYTWAASTSDARALQLASGTGRVAAAWYSNTAFSVDLIFTDGAPHQLAVYCLDWDGNGGRAETLSIQDGTTGAILDTRNVSAFQNGTYVVWNVSGHVVLNVTDTGGDNAVISGLFFDTNSVAAPTFSPGPGSYQTPQVVTITTTTSGASIRYTTDGTTPSQTAGTLYTGPVSVGVSETIKAIGYEAGLMDSTVALAEYTIIPAVSNPTFSPGPGTYNSTKIVTISTVTSGASMRYTTDGSTPTQTNGVLYSGSITVSSTTTLKAIAYATGLADSGVTTAVYSIVPPPHITGAAPTSGVAGTPVTISGSGFGSTQGSGGVWLGSTLGSVTSWSDTQIVATVASGSSSGSAQVQQYGVWSNAVSFAVIGPAITAIVPSSGVPGTSVTISGSGFGSSQGTGQVWLGTTNGTVQSWSDTQIVAVIGSGSASGSARILQNGVWSNAVPFAVNVPYISSVSPATGPVGTSVTITGTGFGSLQGTGTLQLGSTAGLVASWSDTQVVATVASSALSGIVRVQQNGLASNAMSFTVSAAGSSLTLLPNLVNLAIGDTRTLQALSSTGQTLTGLAWASRDTAVVSLSAADPPVLTALAAGHVTITAGTASADVTVWPGQLPLGTVTWSNPGSGSGVAKIVPAVPSANGVADVFAFQNDGTVQAITSDGITAWTGDATNALGAVSRIMPDFQGGLVLAPWSPTTGKYKLYRLDGMTGQRLDYNLGTDYFYSVGLYQDGTLSVVSSTNEVVGLDLVTGAEKFRIMPDAGAGYGDMVVAGDGYGYRAMTVDSGGAEQLKMLQTNSSGAYQIFDIATVNALGANFPNLPPGSDFGMGKNHAPSLISNGADGVLLSWGETLSDNANTCPSSDWTYHLTVVSTGGSVSTHDGPRLPGQTVFPVSPLLQRQDGTFVGAALTGPYCVNWDWSVVQTSMAVFDANGDVLWSVPNEQPMIATEDGGVIGRSGIAYDQNGNATGQNNTTTQSWRGNVYQVGSVNQLALSPIAMALTLWAQAGANPSGNGTAGRPWYFKLVWKNDCSSEPQPCGFTLYPDNPQVLTNLAVDATAQATRIKAAALAAFKAAFDKYPVNVSEGKANTGDHRANVADGIVFNGSAELCGQSSPFPPSYDSSVYYRENMQQAQWALPIQLRTAQDVQNALSRVDLMKAIGVGIGNNAAHELAHQFFGTGFGLDDNSTNTYNGQGCDGARAPWVYGIGTIRWRDVTDNAWKNALRTGWHR